MSESINEHESHDISNYFDAFSGDVNTKNNNTDTKSCKELNGMNINEIPKEIYMSFDVESLSIEKTNIKNIIHLPIQLIYFKCIRCDIPNLDGNLLPDTLKTLIFDLNNTKTISGLKEGITELSLSDNNLLEICVPSSVVSLDISLNKEIKNLPILSDNIRIYDISDTYTSDFDEINSNVTHLKSNNCLITSVSKLPKKLIEWESYFSEISEIFCEFPIGIIKLDLCGNKLSYLPSLMNLLIREIDISTNYFHSVPALPHIIRKVCISGNPELDMLELKTVKKNLKETEFDDDDKETTHIYNPTQSTHMYNSEQSTQSYDFKNFFNRGGMSYDWRNNTSFNMMKEDIFDDEDFSKKNPHFIILKQTYSV
jgi:hypothetical protein